jgi:hypothetical protein
VTDDTGTTGPTGPTGSTDPTGPLAPVNPMVFPEPIGPGELEGPSGSTGPVVSNPPLFIQSNVYSAQMDRHLIGGLLVPSGNIGFHAAPRGGVRAHYVDPVTFEETSLRVSVTGLTQVTVEPGSAFVPGPPQNGISSIYLVTNPTNVTVAVDAPITGAIGQSGRIGIVVTDPGDTPGAPEGTWEFAYISSIPAETAPPIAVSLARITYPTDATKPVVATDDRTFTTALGGTFRVPSKASLASIAQLPYGTQAYAMQEDLMFVRDKGGWGQHPAVALIVDTGQSSGGVTGHDGELMWNKNRNMLSIFVNNGWIDIAGIVASVRLGTATGWEPGPNEKHVPIPSLKIKLPAGGYYNIAQSVVTNWDGSVKGKLPNNSLLLQVNSYTPQSFSVLHAFATVKMWKDAQGAVPDTTNSFWINFEVYTGTGTELDANGKPAGFQQQYALADPNGMKWGPGLPITQDMYLPMVRMSQAINNIRPVFKATNAGYFEITDFHMYLATDRRTTV